MKYVAKSSIADFVNKNSKAYKNLNVDLSSMSEKEIAELLADNPKSVKRPLITDGKSVVIGFDKDTISEKFLNS